MYVKARGNVLGSFVPARYIVAILGSMGIGIVYGLKVNLSMTMVGMLNHTALKPNNSEDGNFEKTEVTEDHDGPFVWAPDVQGIILSCYYWGYLISQLPGGRAAELFSAKWVLLFSVANNALCTILSPVMAKTHYIALMCMRVLEGIGGGVVYPAMNVLLAKWAPPAERGVMTALTFAGSSLGTVISMLITGMLTVKTGWECSFYVAGGLSTIWCVLWIVLIQDSPEKQPFISVQERNMIVMSLGRKAANHLDQKKFSVPWRAAFTSPAFLAILVAHTCSNWGWYLFLTELPFYMKQVLHFNLTENTLSAALPYFSLYICCISLGKTLDWLRDLGIITMTTARKIGTLFSSVVPATCLLALCFIDNNRAAAVTIMAIGVTGTGGQYCGCVSNHMDIAPNFVGTLFAITNTVGQIPGILVPIFVSAMTRDNQTIHSWRIIFYVTVAIYAVEIITYSIFGSGEEQPWNKVSSDKDEVEEALPLDDEEKT